VHLLTELRGTIAAAVTPLRDGGAALDEAAVGPYVDFLVGSGIEGMLAFGTNGEAVLFSVEERQRGLQLALDAADGRFLVAAHCGAQTTSDTVALAAHAAQAGADAVAVIGPPYFKLDPEAQLRHLEAAANACAPLPFYVYEFATTAGYPFALPMLEQLRERVPNFTGLKVSDTPWDAFAPYVLDGLDVFAGPEALIARARDAGAVGAVSALASVFPERVAAVVREPTEDAATALGELRGRIERYPRHAAFKRLLAARGVPLTAAVRAPLRGLTPHEEGELLRDLAPELEVTL
jgi:dihydrodipicolinate synthase/N-acetylneuraminate lyase